MSSEWVNAIAAALAIIAFVWIFHYVLRATYTAAKNMEFAAMERERAMRHRSVERDVAELRQNRYRVYEPKAGELACHSPGVPHQIDTWQFICIRCYRPVRDIQSGRVVQQQVAAVSPPMLPDEHRSITLRRPPNAQ